MFSSTLMSKYENWNISPVESMPENGGWNLIVAHFEVHPQKGVSHIQTLLLCTLSLLFLYLHLHLFRHTYYKCETLVSSTKIWNARV